MRIRILLLLPCLLAFAVAAVGAGSASAVELCLEKAGSLSLCREISGSELELVTLGTFSILQEESSVKKLRILTSTNVIVTCLTGKGEATSESTLIMKGSIIFTECVVESPASCVLGNAEIKAEKIDGTLTLALEAVPGEETEGELTRMDLLLSPEEEEGTFATFTLKSKAGETCPAALENGKVKGAILCFWLEPVEKDEAEHLFECTAAGSESGELKFGGKAADLESEFSVLMLTANGVAHEDSAWGIFENTE